EAGHVALADALAMGTAARNLILLGDPLQLAQVSQGTHPEGPGASVLEHLLGEHLTVAPDKGDLPRSHPAYVSGRLPVRFGDRVRRQARRASRARGSGDRVRHGAALSARGPRRADRA